MAAGGPSGPAPFSPLSRGARSRPRLKSAPNLVVKYGKAWPGTQVSVFGLCRYVKSEVENDGRENTEKSFST